MVLKAMYAGVSGLLAESEALSVTGDNIANVNTTGFKSQRALFDDVLGRSILAGSASASAGAGVTIGSVQQLFTQGEITATGVDTDVALSGDGFFTVQGTVGGVSSYYYTRAGEFELDSDGYLVNASGLSVQGYAANADGTFAASLSSIQVPTGALAANATETVEITANLDSSDEVLSDGWDAQDPSNTSNFSDTMTVYDSLGNSHSLDVYFRKEGDGSWSWHALATGDEIDGGVTDENYEVASGTLAFNSDGALESVDGNSDIFVTFAGASSQTLNLDFGTSIADGGTGEDGITQYAADSSVSSHSQDGYASGDFSALSIDSQGVVMASYTNGEERPLAQLAIAKFRSNGGLNRAGESLWAVTADSGSAAYGVAGSGGRGSVSSASLESSNVDLAEQFVSLIQHQRAYSANSKTITTADEMLQELINIKR